jgi:lysophospholipase L1-like esterase
VIGIGDSITASCGFPAGNLPLASWAQWVARALGEPVDLAACPGATTAEIRRDLLPPASARFRLGLVYCGTNDILKGRDVADFRSDIAAVLERTAEVADAVVTLTQPLWLGRLPTIAPYGRRLQRIYAFGAAIRQEASKVGVHVAQAPELHGPRYIAGDRIHPTAAGQLAFADAAAWRLRDLGFEISLPSSLVPQPDPVTATERREWLERSARESVEVPLRTLARRLVRPRGRVLHEPAEHVDQSGHTITG